MATRPSRLKREEYFAAVCEHSVLRKSLCCILSLIEAIEFSVMRNWNWQKLYNITNALSVEVKAHPFFADTKGLTELKLF